MRVAAGVVLSAWLCAAATGCTRDAVAPVAVAAFAPVFSNLAGPSPCPTAPDLVVATETALRNAVATAPPGSTIAIVGMIAVSFGAIVIDRSDLRLTCAAPGAGLMSNAAAPPGRLIRVHAPRVSVTGLRLDAHLVGIEAVLVQSLPTVVAEDVTLADNDITCGPSTCAFFIGTPRAVITGNRVAATASISGIHVQGTGGRTDGTRVEQNTVTTTGASTDVRFGGIRVRDGSEVVVADNIVTGPWANAIAVTALFGGEVARNDLRGAVLDGVFLGGSTGSATISVDGLVVRNNRITDAGYAGVGVQFTCRSVFVGNNLKGNANNRGAVFFPETGANTLVGNGTIVFDNGVLDCDGDGIADPNMVTGVPRAQKGLPIGPVIGSAVSAAVSDMK